jgi:hypothetical protein
MKPETGQDAIPGSQPGPGHEQPGRSTPPVFMPNGHLSRSVIEGLVRGFRGRSFREEWIERTPERRATYWAAAWLVFVAAVCWIGGDPRDPFATRRALAPVGALSNVVLCLWLIWYGNPVARVAGWSFLGLFTVGIPLVAAFVRL